MRSKGIMHRRQTGRGYKELQDVYMLTKQSINNGTILNTKRHNNRLLYCFHALLELLFLQPRFWFAVWLFNYRKANRCSE